MENGFDVTKFGAGSQSQIENMRFTKAEQMILEYAFGLEEEEFSDEDYYELAFYFAEHN